MLVAAFIFVISFAAMIQFAAFTWHAGLLRVASEPVETGAETAATLSHNFLQHNDFRNVAAYQQLCPELAGGKPSNLRSVRMYYRFLQFLTSASNSLFPPESGWAHREMALCTRYASVVLFQRLERNHAQMAEVRSF